MVRATGITLVGMLVAANLWAAPGQVVVVQGSAAVTKPNGTMEDLRPGVEVFEQDVVEAGESSYLRLLMSDGTVLDLGASTKVVIRDYSGSGGKRKVSLKVWVGTLWARVVETVGAEDNYLISGGNAVAGVRGTELVVVARTDGSADVSVLHGKVHLTSLGSDDAEDLGAMERGRVGADGKITKVRLSGADIAKLKKRSKPLPKLDAREAVERLNGVRERLKLEVTPAPLPLGVPEEADNFDDAIDDLDRLDDDPADPLLDLDPDVTGGLDVEETTRVRGNIQEITP